MFPLYDSTPHRRIPWLTLLIIAANLIVFFRQTQQTELEQFRFVVQYGFIPARVAQLSDPQRVVVVPMPARPGEMPKQAVAVRANPPAIYTSMLTMMFLHGSWLHVLGNMWFLWIFGNNIEDRLGHVVYLLFYLLGGAVAIGCHWVAHPDSVLPVVGASGAVAAVLGGYAVTFPKATVRTLVFIGIPLFFDIPALLWLAIWFLQQVLAARVGAGIEGGVAWWAHIGGFIAGMLLMPLLALGASPPERDWREEVDEFFPPRQ